MTLKSWHLKQKSSAYSLCMSLFVHASETTRGNFRSFGHISAGIQHVKFTGANFALKTERDRIDMAERQEVDMNKPDLLGDG